jgi:hypothetical protein
MKSSITVTYEYDGRAKHLQQGAKLPDVMDLSTEPVRSALFRGVLVAWIKALNEPPAPVDFVEYRKRHELERLEAEADY